MMLRTTAVAAGALVAAACLSTAADAACPIDDPVMFAGLDYGSAAFHTALARVVLEKGYECETDAIPGTTLVLAQGLARGDVDVMMEIWTANPAQPFVDGEKAGTTTRLGTTFPDAREGWFVPRYVVDGEGAEAPDLTSVDQLGDYKALFKDPEAPEKGRFLNCVVGWQCELVNSKKLAAYGLEDDYSNVRPGAGAALEAAVESAYLRKRPVLFYHWAPTWLIGKYDFVMLDEPPHDKATWDAMMAAEEPAAATAYPQTRVVIGANTEFTEKSEALTGFFNAYGMTSDDTSKALAYMRDNDADAEEAAEEFLRTRKDIWSTWVPQDVADRLSAAVAQ